MPRLRWVLLLSIFGLGLAVLLSAYAFEAGRIARLSALIDRRMDEIVRISRVAQSMRSRIAYYATNDGVARRAREDFNLAYPDETIFRIVFTSGDKIVVLSQEP